MRSVPVPALFKQLGEFFRGFMIGEERHQHPLSKDAALFLKRAAT
jgi:hypothetical protein